MNIRKVIKDELGAIPHKVNKRTVSFQDLARASAVTCTVTILDNADKVTPDLVERVNRLIRAEGYLPKWNVPGRVC